MKHYPPKGTGTSGYGHRDNAEHLRWARAVKRGVTACQLCGRRRPLQAHHLDDGGGIAVCSECHRTLDPQAR